MDRAAAKIISHISVQDRPKEVPVLIWYFRHTYSIPDDPVAKERGVCMHHEIKHA